MPNVGPTPEGEQINLSDKVGRMLNELEHAHIFISQQEKRIESYEAEIAAMKAEFADRIGALEALLDVK